MAQRAIQNLECQHVLSATHIGGFDPYAVEDAFVFGGNVVAAGAFETLFASPHIPLRPKPLL
jgi:hypothetical protein